jgi:hypothetical protein
MRRLHTLALLSALVALAGPAHAATGSIWDHNGSKMTLEENGEKRKLVYKEPKEGLDKAGIRPGTVLFNGERKANGRLAGFAKIFKGSCNPLDYFVEGTLNERTGQIVLQGQAPVYTSGTSCEVNGYSDSSPASTLKFAKIGDAPPDANVAASQPPQPQIEQGDGGYAANNNDYLPSTRNRSAERNPQDEPPLAPQTGTQPRRVTPPPAGATPNRDLSEDDAQRDDAQRDDRRYGRNPYDDYDNRRYSRAPGPYQEQRPYVRRRPGIFEPEDETAEDDEDYYEDRYERRPPPSPFWGQRRW